MARVTQSCATSRRSNGSPASPPGWAGCSTASTCTSTCWWPPRSSPSCWASHEKDPAVGYYSSWIQAAFLIGWALGGGFFGRIGDRLGRSRALMLTILTYAVFTGLSFFAQTWWHLLIFRFLAALGIGGEWAVGASLLSETWPRRWRPWMAAVLQTGVNLGVMLAGLANFLLADSPPRSVFLVGVLPALLVLWIRRAVPEPEEWQGPSGSPPSRARLPRPVSRPDSPHHPADAPRLCPVADGPLGVHVLVPAAPAQPAGPGGWTDAEKSQLVSKVIWLVTLASIAGNFLAALLARWLSIGGPSPAVPGLLPVDAGDLQRAAATTIICGTGCRRSASARASSPCSRCICRRCSRRCCGPPARASATTSAASPPDWARSFSGCSPRWATIAWHCCMPDSCSCPRRVCSAFAGTAG